MFKYFRESLYTLERKKQRGLESKRGWSTSRNEKDRSDEGLQGLEPG